MPVASNTTKGTSAFRIQLELLSNLVFEDCRSCGDLVLVSGFNSVFECDACDDFGEIIKAAQLPPVLFGALAELEHHVQHAIA